MLYITEVSSNAHTVYPMARVSTDQCECKELVRCRQGEVAHHGAPWGAMEGRQARLGLGQEVVGHNGHSGQRMAWSGRSTACAGLPTKAHWQGCVY